jgi:transcriptional regulator with XRE-family HTH domain
MSKWTYCDRFKEYCKAYQIRTDKTQEGVALDLEVTLPTLRNFLYGSKKPSTSVLQRASALFGCRVTEFLDDPGAPPPGIAPDVWAEVSERDRVLGSAMLEDLRSIPEEEKDAYYQLWKQGVMIGRARMMAEEKAKKSSEGKGEKKP